MVIANGMYLEMILRRGGGHCGLNNAPMHGFGPWDIILDDILDFHIKVLTSYP